ncbi:methylenetetrahydrofolate reductase [candidate division KSB1 bacterium]|nr:methylenetetrahydrofolate reductase [candidate division KSB1 bacterium]
MTLKQKIESKQFIVCGETGPPQSCDGELIREKSRHFKGIVDAVNITDNQTAIVRLSSIASAKILLDEGVEPIMQMTCRDRNRLAIQSDLLGAAALGINNVLCLTGDYQKFGDHPEAKGVFDLDSIQLVATVAQMNKGYLLSGKEMKKPTEFVIGAAANPFAVPFEMRLIRLYKKVQAGAQFIQTQPVFDMELFARWMEKVVEMGLHEKCVILAGVMPVKSVKALLYMKKEVPGVKISDEYINRMKDSCEPKDEGVKIAVEMIQTLKNFQGVRGIHLMPVMWESITPVIVKEAGLASIFN